MMDLNQIKEVATRHAGDISWPGAAIAYETHVTPAVVVQLIALIRKQEAALQAASVTPAIDLSGVMCWVLDAEGALCQAIENAADIKDPDSAFVRLSALLAAAPTEIPVQTGTATWDGWREFAEAIANNYDSIDRETDEEMCRGCSGLKAWDGKTQGYIEHHRAECIVLRARTMLAAAPAEQAALTSNELAAALDAQGKLTEAYRDIAMGLAQGQAAESMQHCACQGYGLCKPGCDAAQQGDGKLPPLSDESAAVDHHYPIPNNPHASVVQKAVDNRIAFRFGWQAANAQRAGSGKPPEQVEAQGEPAVVDAPDYWTAIRNWVSQPVNSMYQNEYADAVEAAVDAHTARAVADARGDLRIMFAELQATMAAKQNILQQAQQHAMEAKAQRSTVSDILKYFGCPDESWRALELIKAAQPSQPAVSKCVRCHGKGFVHTDIPETPSIDCPLCCGDSSLAPQPAGAVQEPREWHELASQCLAAMKMAVHFRKTGQGRPPEQTCLHEIEELEAMLTAPPAAVQPDSSPFQQRVQPWLMACFGEMIAGDREERNHRFLEESLELVQACGCTASEAHQLVEYVYGRPTGEPAQEVGGVMVTLAALCLAQGLDMHGAAEIELARIWTKVEVIRAKQAAKPKYSPLPEFVQPDSERDAAQRVAAVQRYVCWIPDSRGMVADTDGAWVRRADVAAAMAAAAPQKKEG